MTDLELAKEIARGLIETGVEGGTDSVSCSTNGDYPSIGCSQWEGDRADRLLAMINGGEQYTGKSYSELLDNDMLGGLAELISSPEGEAAQIEMLSEDTETYVDWLQDIGSIDNPRCIIYAGMWCPTSHAVVCRFLERHEEDTNLCSLFDLFTLFLSDYADFAQCSEYYDGYANRAETTYEYVSHLDLSQYGESDYIYGE